METYDETGAPATAEPACSSEDSSDLYEVSRADLVQLFLMATECAYLRCESPIERRLVRALIRPDSGSFQVQLGRRRAIAGTHDGMLYAQYEVGGYRLDFAAVGAWGKVAIECDGHDFHERTKEQAAKDRARDRALLRDGWSVLRFTGSEIHKDADKCALEVAMEVDRLRALGVPPDRNAYDSPDYYTHLPTCHCLGCEDARKPPPPPPAPPPPILPDVAAALRSVKEAFRARPRF